MQLTPEIVQKYCENTPNQILAHGTVDSVVPDILKNGLLVRDYNYITVLFANHGMYYEDQDEEPITHYTWNEPRSSGKNCVVLFEIPQSILQEIVNSGQKICQKTVFEKICQEIELTASGDIENSKAYEKEQEEQVDNLFGDIPINTDFQTGNYKGLCVPPQYICAVTSSEKVYYANGNVIEFSKNLDKNKQPTKQEESYFR